MGFDPITMTAMAVGSTVLSAASAYSGAEAKSAQSAYQAQVAANNAQLAEQDARYTIQAGEAQATNYGMKVRAAVGQQKAAQGASGIDVNTGSAVDVRAGTEALGMLDALTIRSNAAKAAYAKQVEAWSDTQQSQLYQSQSEQEAASAPLLAAGTLLSGASSVGEKWGKYQTLYGSSRGVSSIGAGVDAMGNPFG